MLLQRQRHTSESLRASACHSDGTDEHGRRVEVRTTDADGRYPFTGSAQETQDAGVVDLVIGHSTVTFSRHGLPPGSRFTAPGSSATMRGHDSDADPWTGRASGSLPDPRSTTVDGEDVDVDAGGDPRPSAPSAQGRRWSDVVAIHGPSFNRTYE